eukprot:CAMPEP_0183343694 /NCGR_PEP_ID=MMETSP0164_2-20130417/9544_1 /TAXON_ID=221442 /ORGANISM="Coccolithus pelagicus ssp braarudi, Strain PLY182g" /LENGTH=68 /DNA_ID=CAMNT_0025514567 /DNA_START=18 /DNA_END=224 /DNA_ORIENTATION=+
MSQTSLLRKFSDKERDGSNDVSNIVHVEAHSSTSHKTTSGASAGEPFNVAEKASHCTCRTRVRTLTTA